MSPPRNLPSSALPMACRLNAADGAERWARWRALSARGAPLVEREAEALVVRYPSGDGVHEELEWLAAAERRCCSFADWEVAPEEDHTVLRIRSHPDGLEAIAELFNAD